MSDQSKLQEEVDKAKQKLGSHAENHKKVQDFTEKLADGYVTSIQVIIDVSKLITTYKEMVTGLINEINSADLDSSPLTNLSKDTKDHLAKIEEHIKNQFGSLKTIASASGDKGKVILEQVKQLEDKTAALTTSARQEGGTIGRSLRQVLHKIYPSKKKTRKVKHVS